MDLDAYLSLHNTSLDAIEIMLEETVGLDEDDIVMLAGSVIEELGNPTSDLDIYLLSKRDRDDLTPVHTKVLVVGDTVVDVDVYTLAQVDELLGRFKEWAEGAQSALDAFTFSWKDRELLHSFRIARVLRNHQAAERIRSCIGQADLARHKLDHARHHVGTHQVDLAGLFAERDWYTLFYVAQELVGHAADALLAGYLQTNPKRKWRMRLLSTLPDDWEADIPGRTFGVSALNRCWSLMCATPDMSETEIYSRSLAISAFARNVTVWAQWKLQSTNSSNEKMPAALAQLPGFTDTGIDAPLPALDLDVGFDFVADRFAIYRLNHDAPGVELSASALAVLSLFDGETTGAQAAASLYGIDYNQAREEVEKFRALVRVGGFEAPILPDHRMLAEVLGQHSPK